MESLCYTLKLAQHCISPIFQYKIKIKLKKHFKEICLNHIIYCVCTHVLGSSIRVTVSQSQCEALLTLLFDRLYPTQEEWEEERGIIQVSCFLYAFASLTQFIFELGFFSRQTLPFTRAQKSRSKVAEAPAPGLTLFSVEVSWSAGTHCIFWRWLYCHR